VGEKLSGILGPRVLFVDETIFPINWVNVSEVMIQSVRDKGIYPLNDKTPFEHMIYGRTGWFLQQLLKLYAGRLLNITDYVLLDSDIVWFRNVSFIYEKRNKLSRYYYASSTQYHAPYMATLTKISGVGVFESKEKIFRSGIVHHMVIVREVLEDLFAAAEKRHGGMPFWQVLLNESALEMTCRAPRLNICGAGSTLSEYELYLNYAQQRFPETVVFRPLLWANGPMPGLLFWPPEHQVDSDGPKRNWLGHRQAEVEGVLEKQMIADAAQGFHYIGYHGYAKRRYFELHGVDINSLCQNVSLLVTNTTCSWRGFENSNRTVTDWFSGCGCYMANHQKGP